MLLPHHSYDLKIDLEEGTPPPNHMYSLSQSELETLRAFIEEYSTFKISSQCSDPLHQKEGQKSLTLHGLLQPELHHQERSLPFAPTNQPPRCTQESSCIHQN